ncbi:MAG: hypothetical protein ACRELV_07390 [Longimicrobiales bacterium]
MSIAVRISAIGLAFVGASQDLAAQDFTFSVLVAGSHSSMESAVGVGTNGQTQSQTSYETFNSVGAGAEVYSNSVPFALRVVGSSSVSGRLYADQYETESCGERCTRTTAEPVQVGKATVLGAHVDLLIRPILYDLIRPYLLGGLGYRQFHHSSRELSMDVSEGEGFRRLGGGTEVLVGDAAVVWLEVVRERGGVFDDGKTRDHGAVARQVDWKYSFGVRVSVLD